VGEEENSGELETPAAATFAEGGCVKEGASVGAALELPPPLTPPPLPELTMEALALALGHALMLPPPPLLVVGVALGSPLPDAHAVGAIEKVPPWESHALGESVGVNVRVGEHATTSR